MYYYYGGIVIITRVTYNKT